MYGIEDESLLEQPGQDAPVVTIAMGVLAVLAIPVLLFVVFVVWPESLERQFAATGAVMSLVVLACYRRKFEALLLASVFLSQFYLSLYSFPLDPPVRFQFFFSDVLLFVLVLVAIERRARFRLDSIGWLFLGLCFWFAVTTFTSVHPHRSLIFLLGQVKYLVLYGLALGVRMEEKLAGRVAVAVLWVVVLQALLAMAQTIKGGPLGLSILGEISSRGLDAYLIEGSLRASGTIAGTNSFAGYLAMLLVFLLPFLLARGNPVLCLGYGLGGLALILALSRAGWLSFAVGVGCVMFMVLRAKIVRPSRLLLFTLVAGVALAAGVGLYYERIMHRFQDREAIHSAMGRLTQIEGALEVVGEYPLMGIGPGVTEFFGRWNNHLKYVKRELPGVDLPNQVHSSQLQIAIESGVPGLALLLLLTAALVPAVFRKPGPGLGSDDRALLRIGGTCAAVAVMVHVSFGTEFNNQQIFTALWVLLGLARSWRGELPEEGHAAAPDLNCLSDEA